MHKIFFILITVSVLFCSKLFAQENKQIDSLLDVIKKSNDDTNRVKSILELATLKRYNQTSEAVTYAEQALKTSKRLNFETGVAESYKVMGILYATLNDLYPSIQYFDSSYTVFKKLRDQKKMTIILTNLGAAYTSLGNYSKALSFHIQSLKIAEDINDSFMISVIYNNIAFLYTKQNIPDKAISYYRKCSSIRTANPDNSQLILAYSSLAYIFKNQRQFDSALYYYNKLVAIAGESNNLRIIASAYGSIAKTYIEIKDYNKAIEYYNKTNEINNKLNDKKNITSIFNGLGEIYFKLKDIKKAETYFLKAYEISNEKKFLEHLKTSAYYLALINDSLKNPVQALNYYKVYIKIKDSLINEQKNKQILEMETKYLFEKKEKEIAVLNQDKAQSENKLKTSKYFRNLLLIAFVFVFILSLFFHRNYILKKRANKLLLEINSNIEKQKEELKIANEALENENILAQFETLKNQVNPHFLFNCLNALASLINVNKEKALCFVAEFSKVYRNTLDLKSKLLIDLNEELQLVNSYMYLQKIRFGDSLQININISQEAYGCQIPPFALQILVENAIKHNSISCERPLILKLYSENDYLVLENNIQLRNEQIISTGIGQKNLISRYSLISDLEPVFLQRNNLYIAKIPLLY